MDINFKKNKDALLPVIVQDAKTKTVLMLGYMNDEAYRITLQTKKVTFFSRSKNRLWTKGEESGNYLHLIDSKIDCDNDTLLIKVNPNGPTCHTGDATCWKEKNQVSFGFLSALEATIHDRRKNLQEKSYVASLFESGINKIAQKVGEEAVELVIETKDSNPALFLNEAADLLFHYLILLQAKGFQLCDVEEVLRNRSR